VLICGSRTGSENTQLADDYQRFSKTKSLRFNLAYAEGFPAWSSSPPIVANFAEFSLSDFLKTELDSPTRRDEAVGSISAAATILRPIARRLRAHRIEVAGEVGA
jgi:hypothetical protein